MTFSINQLWIVAGGGKRPTKMQMANLHYFLCAAPELVYARMIVRRDPRPQFVPTSKSLS